MHCVSALAVALAISQLPGPHGVTSLQVRSEVFVGAATSYWRVGGTRTAVAYVCSRGADKPPPAHKYVEPTDAHTYAETTDRHSNLQPDQHYTTSPVPTQCALAHTHLLRQTDAAKKVCAAGNWSGESVAASVARSVIEVPGRSEVGSRA